MDLSIALTKEISADDIARIVLFSETGGGTGWEIQDPADFEISADTIHIRNLSFRTPPGGDAQFDVTLDWNSEVAWEDAQSAEYRFVHKGVFSDAYVSSVEWYDREELRVDLNVASPSAFERGQIHWLSGDDEVGTSRISNEDLTEMASFSDVPATANAYYVEVHAEIQGVQTVLYGSNAPLPERIPPNVEFVEGIELGNGELRPSDVWTHDDAFLALIGEDSGYGSVKDDATLHVIGASDRAVHASYELGDDVRLVEVVDGRVYVSYGSGTVEEIVLGSSEQHQVAQLEAPAEGLTRIGKWLLVSAEVGYDEQVFTVDAESGEVAHSSSFRWYAPNNFAYLPSHERGFADKGGISPQDLMAFSFDEATGVISNVRDSPYHGDYDIAGPFTLTPDGSEIVTRAGTVFATDDPTPMEYVGSYGHPTASLVFDAGENRSYALRLPSRYYSGPDEVTLDVYETESRSLERAVPLQTGTPLQLLQQSGGQLSVLSATGERFPRIAIATFDEMDVEATAVQAFRVVEPTAALTH